MFNFCIQLLKQPLILFSNYCNNQIMIFLYKFGPHLNFILMQKEFLFVKIWAFLIYLLLLLIILVLDFIGVTIK